MVVATSGGNQLTEVVVEGHQLYVGCNAYYKR